MFPILLIFSDRTYFLSCRPRLKPSLFDGWNTSTDGSKWGWQALLQSTHIFSWLSIDLVYYFNFILIQWQWIIYVCIHPSIYLSVYLLWYVYRRKGDDDSGKILYIVKRFDMTRYHAIQWMQYNCLITVDIHFRLQNLNTLNQQKYHCQPTNR